MGALEKLVAGLPADLPAALFVVWHLSPGVRSVLSTVLTKAGALPASYPNDGDPIEPGRIYVGPNDHHMLLERGYIRVTKGPKERMEAEVKIAREADARIENILQYGELSPFTCPECHGVLSMFRDGSIIRFRCHTGHALSAGSLLEAGTEQVEQRLFDALRALDETIMLLNQLGEEYARHGNTQAAERCYNRARDAYERSRPIREAALVNEEITTDALRQASS
jgi:CheB methylesterase